MRTRTALLGVLLILSSWPATFASTPADEGYFLSWQQKKELLWLGRIEDAQHAWYDVWICPGYLPPAQHSWKYLKKTGRDFGEYIHTNKYHVVSKVSRQCLHWALQDCGMGFTVKGIPRGWSRNFKSANERHERRVFGWWLAYPWAFLESSVETAFRAGLGAAGTALGVSSGIVFVPSYAAVDSAVKGAWDLSVNTVVLPVAGLAWNTVATPPLALIGQKPSESRVDGFWVVKLSTAQAESRPGGAHSVTPDDIPGLAQWGQFLYDESRDTREEQKRIDDDFRKEQDDLRERQQALWKEMEGRRKEIFKKQREEIASALERGDNARTFSAVSAVYVPGGPCEAEIRRRLQDQGLSAEAIAETLELLEVYPSPAAELREKTDPVKRAAEIVGESIDDTLEGVK